MSNQVNPLKKMYMINIHDAINFKPSSNDRSGKYVLFIATPPFCKCGNEGTLVANMLIMNKENMYTLRFGYAKFENYFYFDEF